MQRAAASSPSVPQSQARSSDAPPSKRQKVSVAPSSTATSRSDLQLIQIALAEEERKRGKAIERLAEEAGETNWTLSTVNGEGGHGVGVLRVAKAGYTDIDQEARRPVTSGRRSFGKFNRDLEVRCCILCSFHLFDNDLTNYHFSQQISCAPRSANLALPTSLHPPAR